MLFRDFFVRRKPRTFGFTPYYYQEQASQETDEDAPRIRFRKIRAGVKVGRRSVRSMVILVVFIVALLVYFSSLVEKEISTKDLKNLRIEEIPSGF